MRRELQYAAENTLWREFGLHAIYIPRENVEEYTLEMAISQESLMCACAVRNIVADELYSEEYALSLLNKSPEYILSEYCVDHPELCLILCHLTNFGTISPYGVAWPWLSSANYVFGIFDDSPLYRADFCSKKIPIIRITRGVFTLGTNQPRFDTIDDVKTYYRDDARIEEIAKMCMFWIRKFYE